MRMRQVPSFQVPAHGELTLKPGGNHLMFFGLKNPFKPGELMDIAAKPASTKVKVRPLKNLKDMVQA